MCRHTTDIIIFAYPIMFYLPRLYCRGLMPVFALKNLHKKLLLGKSSRSAICDTDKSEWHPVQRWHYFLEKAIIMTGRHFHLQFQQYRTGSDEQMWTQLLVGIRPEPSMVAFTVSLRGYFLLRWCESKIFSVTCHCSSVRLVENWLITCNDLVIIKLRIILWLTYWLSNNYTSIFIGH